MRRPGALLLLATILIGACISAAPTEQATTTQAPDVAREPVAPTATATPLPRPIPRTGQVWLTPHPPGQDAPGTPNPRMGELDYLDLFKADAPWQRAAAHVHIFKFYPQLLEKLSDGELRSVLADLNRRGIAIALEVGPLVPTSTCGMGVESFNGSSGPAVARRLRSLGSTLRFAALDEPYFYGSLFAGPNACRWTARKVAEEMSLWIAEMRTIVPDILVGDIEPLADPASAEMYAAWLDTFRSVSGANFPFFHLDVDWNRPRWGEEAKALEDAVRQRGIAFGMLYFGDDGSTDRRWIELAEERMGLYESLYGGKPDQVVIQSFHDRPHHALPETDPSAFTYLVNRYFRQRTAIAMDAAPHAGGVLVAGKLTTSDGTIANARVTLVATPQDGTGRYAEYVYTGIVPAGVRRALVGMRVNHECGCRGETDISLYGVSYEAGDQIQRVPNGSFRLGLNGWGQWGTAAALIEPIERGVGRLLHVVSGPDQLVGLNSTDFSVIPGESYTVTFSARVAPRSLGSGYFTLIFLAEVETSRRTFAFDAASSQAIVAASDAGLFTYDWTDLGSGHVRVLASWSGDDARWPAYAAAQPLVP